MIRTLKMLGFSVRQNSINGFLNMTDLMQWCPFWIGDPHESISEFVSTYGMRKCIFRDLYQETGKTQQNDLWVIDCDGLWAHPVLAVRPLVDTEYCCDEENLNQKLCRVFVKNCAKQLLKI